MVSAQGSSVRKEPSVYATPTIFDRANALALEFAARAALHDRDASFPFENFDQLSEAGLLAVTVPTALGGSGAGALDAARIIGIFGKADPSTALVLSMHYIQHLVMARSTRWPGRLSRKLAREAVEGMVACGLATAVVPRVELRKRAHDTAIALTKRPAGSLSLTKKLMRDHQRIAAQIAEEGQLFKERLKTPKAREAFAAFAERRSPDFTKVA
jgi:hypothetical protein